MALRRTLGWSDGELMRSDAKPCTRLMRHTAGISSVYGGLSFWILCRLHYALGTKYKESLALVSKDNNSKEPQVGILRCNICELYCSATGPSFQPRV